MYENLRQEYLKCTEILSQLEIDLLESKSIQCPQEIELEKLQKEVDLLEVLISRNRRDKENSCKYDIGKLETEVEVSKLKYALLLEKEQDNLRKFSNKTPTFDSIDLENFYNSLTETANEDYSEFVSNVICKLVDNPAKSLISKSLLEEMQNEDQKENLIVMNYLGTPQPFHDVKQHLSNELGLSEEECTKLVYRMIGKELIKIDRSTSSQFLSLW